MTNYQETELDEEIDLPDQEEISEFLDPVMKPFNPSEIDIVVESKSLDVLIKRIQHGEIDMNTDFQRHADLWDNRKMSRLIESILIRFPLPAFYFDASEDENWLIDRQQNLYKLWNYSSLFSIRNCVTVFVPVDIFKR